MPNRFLKRIVIILIFSIFGATHMLAKDMESFEHPKLGKCFTSINSFLIQEFGKSYSKQDVVVEKIAASHGRFIWIIDKTPSVNYVWYLMNLGKNKKAQLVLVVPAASSVEILKYGENGKPMTIRAISPPHLSFHGSQIDFAFSVQEKIYTPIECGRIDMDENTQQITVTSVPCESIYE